MCRFFFGGKNIFTGFYEFSPRDETYFARSVGNFACHAQSATYNKLLSWPPPQCIAPRGRPPTCLARSSGTRLAIITSNIVMQAPALSTGMWHTHADLLSQRYSPSSDMIGCWAAYCRVAYLSTMPAEFLVTAKWLWQSSGQTINFIFYFIFWPSPASRLLNSKAGPNCPELNSERGGPSIHS